MNKEEIYQLIEQSKLQAQELNKTISKLQQHLRDIVEENNRLLLLNYDLRELAQNLHSQIDVSLEVAPDDTSRRSKWSGKDHLIEFYEEGIHICHMSYGQQRSSLGQDCLLCLGVISQFEES